MALDYAKLGSSFSGLNAFAENPEAMELTRNTINLRIGKQIPFKGTIAGQKVNAFATLKSAKLTRLSLLRQTRKQPSSSPSPDYYIVTGAFSPVDVEVMIEDDGNYIALHEVWRHMTNALGQTQYDKEAFLAHLTRIGLNYTNGGFPLYFQQMGADEDKIEATFNLFRDLGAVDDHQAMQKAKGDGSRPQRMERTIKHDTGIPVTFFELGQVDREKVTTGQGFIDLIDAMSGQFDRVTSQRNDANVLQMELENNNDLSDAKIKKINEKIKLLRNQSMQYTAVWSGSQQITVTNSVTKQIEYTDRYAPTNAPCGRFDLLVDGETINIDLWKNSAREATSNSDAISVPKLKTINASSNPLGGVDLEDDED
jgi:hypothetical protein